MKARPERLSLLQYLLLTAALLAAMCLCVCLGSVNIPLRETLAAFGTALRRGAAPEGVSVPIILRVRVPRVLCVALSGAGLSLAGACMQGLLRNPLADGSTLGVSSGAALGAVIAIAFGLNFPSLPFAGTTVMAVLFAFGSLALILALAYRLDYSLSTNTIILIGVIYSMFVSSAMSVLVTFASDKLKSITFWTMGSFQGSTYGNAALLAAALSVCPLCGYHFPMGAYYRLSSVLDPGSFRELHEKLTANDPLRFPGYGAKLDGARRKTGMNEAVVTATGTMGGSRCVVGVLDSRFLMGSMSAAVGEKLTLAIEYAGKNKLPLILFAASGGARMQEGILSLMQMAKTSAALARFSEKGLLYISVLTDPTTGGVTASFASLGDIILAEPGALIGFAGPRVIQQTIGETLPEGFQRAEFQMEHGFVDAVVPRKDLRDTLIRLLKLHGKGERHG